MTTTPTAVSSVGIVGSGVAGRAAAIQLGKADADAGGLIFGIAQKMAQPA